MAETVQPIGQEAEVRRRSSGRWVSFILLGAGIAILIAFAATVNFRQVAEALRRAEITLLGAAVGAVVAQILFKAYRWQFMVKQLTGTTISIRFSAISVVAGVAAGSFTPGRSFELAKAVMLKGSYDVSLGVSTSAMIVERMLDMGFIVVAFLLSAAFVPSRMVLASRVLMLMIVILVVAFGVVVTIPQMMQGWIAGITRYLPLPGSLRDKGLRLLDTFFSSFQLLREHRTLWLLLLLSVAVIALDLLRVFTVFRAMGIPLAPPLIAFAYLGAAMLGMALLIPGGVGITEVSMAGLIILLAPGAAAPSLARSAVLVDRFLSYYLLVLIGAGLLVAYHRFRHVFV
ncbi:MAG TPA: lysylphosphatidylglycerol synthase transmembrane domain-containing protein [bacterium]|nr:lysylphosphatidylglycerol synthase transmembrane domain-containing protein [bacterium]